MENFVSFIIIYLLIGSIGVILYFLSVAFFAKLFPEYKIPVIRTSRTIMLCLLPFLSFLGSLNFVYRIIYVTKIKNLSIELYLYLISCMNYYDNGKMSFNDYIIYCNNISMRYKYFTQVKK